MSARNGPEGYGWVTKVLHWATVVALVTQFALAWSLDIGDGPDCDPPGEELSGGETSDAFEERLDRLEEACEERVERAGDYVVGDDALLTTHVALGAGIFLLGLARLAWRRISGLPEWSPHLSAKQRVLATWTERALLSMLLAMPATGVLLVLSGDDTWVPLHVATHIVLLAALVAHLTLNLRPRVLRRMA